MQETFLEFLKQYPLTAPAIFIVARSLAIIIPPIPGAFIDVAGIVFFGPVWGFVYAETGLMLGAMVSFWIARRFREPAVRRFASLGEIAAWERTLSRRKKFWSLVIIRLFTNAVFDYVSYAAGLLNIGTAQFFLASLIGSLPGTIAFYYFGSLFYQSSVYYFVVFIAALLVLGAILTKRGSITDILQKIPFLKGEAGGALKGQDLSDGNKENR